MHPFQKVIPSQAAKVVLVSCLVLLSPKLTLAVPEDPTLVRIGVLAIRGAGQCREQWEATGEYLTAEIPDYTFVIRPLDHDDVAPAVERGEVDFILVNPSLYVELERLHGASRIATLKSLHLGRPYTVYAGVIFCRSDRADIRDLSDLRGKTFMAVDERSLGGWQMAWRELKQHGIDPRRDFSDLRFAGTHDAVVDAIRDKQVDAGTVRADTLERMASEGKIRLEEFRVIGARDGGPLDLPFPRSTQVYPEWPFAKVRHTSDHLAQQVAVALMRMSPESPAAKAARCAGWAIPQNYQAVHECLRELRIGPYKDYGKVTLGVVVRRYWPWLAGAGALLVIAVAVSVHVTRLNRKLGSALSKYREELAERMRAEKALRRSEQLRADAEKLAAIGRLAAGVAHEINNPLTGVLTFAHLLREKENMDAQDKEDLDLIVEETTRAAEIVGGLLDFARERPSAKEPLNLNEVIRRTIRLLGNQEAFRQITIVEELAENLPQVSGDGNQLQQVLLNLSLNACEAMPDGGTLLIASSAENEKVFVKVTDTGCGIAADQLGEVFEPFYSTKSVGKGTGLGLSVSYGIVQQHGGDLHVESRVGKGTTFAIVLPPAEDNQSSNDDKKRNE